MSLPNKGVAYDFFMSLVDSGDAEAFKLNPTLAEGDFVISKDGGAFANLATLPEVLPAGGFSVKVSLSAVEMNADKIMISAVDQAGAEWFQAGIFIDIPTGSTESVVNILEGDHDESFTHLTIFQKGTTIPLVDKDITGSLLSPGVVIKTLEP